MVKRLSRRKNTLKRKTLKRKTIKKYTGGGMLGLSFTKSKNRWRRKYELMKQAWLTEVRGALEIQYNYMASLLWLKNNTLPRDGRAVVGKPFVEFVDFLKQPEQAASAQAYIDKGVSEAETRSTV